MKNYALWTLLGTAVVAPAMAQGDVDASARRAAIHELYLAQHRDKIVDAIIQSQATLYVTRLAQMYPKLSKNQLIELRAKIEINLKETKNDYLAQEEAMVARQVSLQDLRSAIAFYRSPVGQRLADATVAILPVSGKNQSVWVSAGIARATKDMNSTAKAAK